MGKTNAVEKFYKNMFQLKPDLLVDGNNETFILDTKWKRISNLKYDNNYGISQSDYYQMFAYGHKYMNGQGKMVLIYPKWAKFGDVEDKTKKIEFNLDETTIETILFHLKDETKLIKNIHLHCGGYPLSDHLVYFLKHYSIRCIVGED